MTLLTLILMISAIALSSYNYLKVLYQAKRKIRIVTVETVKSASGQEKQRSVINEYPQAPGPRFIWPIIGNLAEMGKYAVPSVAFTELAKQYGDIYSMTLGSTRCLVVNNLALIREVLNLNGKIFGARPDFIRFHKLFGGDRGNCKCNHFIIIFIIIFIFIFIHHSSFILFFSQCSLELFHFANWFPLQIIDWVLCSELCNRLKKGKDRIYINRNKDALIQFACFMLKCNNINRTSN